MNLAFGYSHGIPEGIKTAWGARLIAPNDLLWDRQDLIAENDGEKKALVAWLNGETRGQGAIKEALDWLKRYYGREIRGDEPFQHILYEDDQGIVVGNTNASYGYVYVAGWLKV